MRKRISLIVAGIGIATSAVLASPASAASYDGFCDASDGGEACLYYLSNFSGPIYDTLHSKYSYTGTFYGTETYINNEVASVWNRDTVNWLTLYDNTGYTGAKVAVAPGGYIAYLSDYGFANRASSHCFSNVSSCPN
ncbi:peptidase inhibitor family I36 protein [Kitasatospora purpeofusca]|uniref:peptidase inhibitor family I36 protein n=1 Tax=Kitasatospora purpeofusca TaxID=67352 RepID=UPI0036D23A83